MIANTDSSLWKRVMNRREDIVSRRVAGETILVPLRGTAADMQRIFTMNPVGAFIWDALDGRKSLGDVRDEVLACFDVEKEDVERDIQEFVGDLQKEGLIGE